MSWGEVKKVNSDLGVPLNERITYIAGIIPRDTEVKVVSTTNTGDVSEHDLLSVVGSGCITDISMLAQSKLNGSWSDARCTMKIIADDEIVTTIVLNSITSSPGKSTYTASVDFNDMYALKRIDKDLTLESNEIRSDAFTIPPITFKKSLSITFSCTTWGSKAGYSEASIKYALF